MYNLLLQEGWTALMAASQQGNTDIVELLLKRGANPNAMTGVRYLKYLSIKSQRVSMLDIVLPIINFASLFVF